MIYKAMNAVEAYAHGLQTRVDQASECGPMPFSIYKILECHRTFHNLVDDFDEIGSYVRCKKKPFTTFNFCTSEDKAVFVKYVPALVCHDLGRNLVGVLHGLTGDGVSKRDIEKIESHVQRQIEPLLELAEAARLETKHHWAIVSKQLGTGNCALDELIEKVVNLLDWVMDSLIEANPTTPSGPFEHFKANRDRHIK